MNKICTSIEQSQKLIELGIDVKTADMYYTSEYVTPSVITGSKDDYSTYIPAWSLSALLELIPNCIINKTDDKTFANLYYNLKSSYDNILDAAFGMVCCLLENNKI